MNKYQFYKIIARNGNKGDFFQMTIKARTENEAVKKALNFGLNNGFLSANVLSVLKIEGVK